MLQQAPEPFHVAAEPGFTTPKELMGRTNQIPEFDVTTVRPCDLHKSFESAAKEPRNATPPVRKPLEDKRKVEAACLDRNFNNLMDDPDTQQLMKDTGPEHIRDAKEDDSGLSRSS